MSKDSPRVEFITNIVTAAVTLAFSALWVMLCEGAVAGAHGWPTLSYWQSVLTVIGLGSIVQYGTLSVSQRIRGRGTR